MTKDFDYDNLPDEMTMDALPEELFPAAQEAFAEALASGEVKVAEAKAGYLYDRKSYLTVDAMGRYRNAYGANDDDIVLQLTVRVSSPKSWRGQDTLPKLAALEAAVIAKEEEAEKAALEAEIAAQEATAKQAANAAAAAAEKLAKLKEKQAK